MRLLEVQYRVGVHQIFQGRVPGAVQLSGHGNHAAGREQFRVQKIRARGDEPSGTRLRIERSQVRVQRQRKDVQRPAVRVVVYADDSSAPDDGRTTRAFGVVHDLAIIYGPGLSPNLA